MKSKTRHKVWAIFSLLVWLNLVPEVLAPPLATAAEIKSKAEFYVQWEARNSKDHTSSKSIEEWEDEITSEAWFDWTNASLLFAAGLLATWQLWRNSKYWPWLLGILSATITFEFGYLMITEPIYYEYLIEPLVEIGLGKELPSISTINLYMLPIYTLVLLFVSLYEFHARYRDKASAA